MFRFPTRQFRVAALRLCALAGVLWLAAGQSLAVSAQEPTVDERFGAVEAYQDPLAAAESRVGWERITFDWSLMQPSADSGLVNAGLDEAWFTEARTAGREVVGMLVNTPAWATEGRAGIGVPAGLYASPDSSTNVWAQFVREVVTSYARRGVNHWIIWDNPNIPSAVYGHGWEGTVQDYYQMVRVAYVVAKQANPEAQIHLAGYSLAYDAQWFSRLMELMADDGSAAANDYYFDVASIHLYYETEAILRSAANAFFVMQDAGIAKDLWIVEAGAYPPDIALQEYPEVTAEQQAAFVLQAFALGMAAGVQRTGGPHFVDTPDDDGVVTPGLLGPGGGARPAYHAFRVATTRFAGVLAASRTELPLSYYVKLRHGDRVTHVVWARTAQPVLVRIPASVDSATLVDQAGNERGVTAEGGAYSVRVEGATCNGERGSCPIGGPVMVLVEQGIDPFVDPTPAAPVEDEAAPTLSPEQMTPTATVTPPPSPTATQPPVTEEAVVEATIAPEVATVQTETATVEPEATLPPTPVPALPTGAAATLPFALVGLGALLIGGGLGFWLRDRSGTDAPKDG